LFLVARAIFHAFHSVTRENRQLKDAAKDVAEDVTQDVAEDVLGVK